MTHGVQAAVLALVLASAGTAAAQHGEPPAHPDTPAAAPAPHRPLRSGVDLTRKPGVEHATAGDKHAPPGTGAAAGHAPAEHGADHAGHAEGGHHELPPINWTDFDNKVQVPYAALVINFAILLGIYVYFGRRPLAAALKKRRTDIAKEIEDAQRMKREAEERAKTYQAKLSSLEKELAEARAALVEAGKGERDRIVREAEERAVRMSKDAHLLLEQELAQMKQDLVRETVVVAVKAAEEILRSSVTQSDQERLAEELLRDLGKRPSAAGGAS